MDKSHRRFLFSLTIILGLFAIPCFSQQTVTVGWYEVPQFQQTDNDGGRSGYVYEFLQQISERTGFSYKYINGTKQECINMLDKGIVDIVCSLCPGEEPSHAVLCSIPLATSYLMLVARKDDDRFSFDDYTAMNGMTVVSSPSVFQESKFRALPRNYDFSVRTKLCITPEAALSELQHGNADLALVSSITATQDFTVVSQFGMHNFFIGVTKNKPALMSEMDATIEQIITETPDYEQTLSKAYLAQSTTATVSLTKKEKQFIAKSPHVTVYIKADTPVLSFVRNGEFHGMAKYIFDYISNTTNLKFDYIPFDENKIAIENTCNNKNTIDGYVISDFKWGEENNLHITAPVADYALVLVYQKNMSHNIYTVSYHENNFLPDSFIQNAPYTMIPYETREDAINAVLKGDCDAFLTSMYIAQTFLEGQKYKNLIMSAPDNLKLSLAFGISQTSDKELYSIIDKSIRNIPQDERNSYLRESISDSFVYTLGDFIRQNSIVLLLVILVFMLLLFMTISQKRNAMRLAEANKNKDIFLANMSHDFRTPLTAIKGFAYLGQTEKNVKYYDQILSSSEYLLELVKDILNIQEYAQGKTLELTPTANSTLSLCDGILEVVNTRAKAKRISIQKNYSIEHQYINVDELRFKQAFINIINNSIKYSPEDSTIIWNVHDKVENDGTVHLLSEVIDYGVGMSEDFIKTKLFKAFEREHNKFSLAEGGTGLGLVITKMVISRMMGTITVSSTLGKGTTFSIDLPIQTLSAEEFETQTKQKRPKIQTKDFAGKHILVCEDNELNTFIIKNILEKKGCIVETAENGKVGVEKFRQSAVGQYHAILMDIRMPVLDGLSATKEIRSLKRKDAGFIPIIALSANASENDKTDAAQAGINDHLSKPIDVDKLFETLAAYL